MTPEIFVEHLIYNTLYQYTQGSITYPGSIFNYDAAGNYQYVDISPNNIPQTLKFKIFASIDAIANEYAYLTDNRIVPVMLIFDELYEKGYVYSENLRNYISLRSILFTFDNTVSDYLGFFIHYFAYLKINQYKRVKNTIYVNFHIYVDYNSYSANKIIATTINMFFKEFKGVNQAALMSNNKASLQVIYESTDYITNSNAIISRIRNNFTGIICA